MSNRTSPATARKATTPGSRAPTHSEFNHFDVIDGELSIGGIALTRLAARVGSTPFFAYERSALDTRVAALRKHLPKDVSLHYAIKANPMPAVVQHMAGLVEGLDVASVAEMHVALDTRMPAHEISFAGPGKTPHELSCAVAAGITLNVESQGELNTIVEAGASLGIEPRVCLRVNPDFELKTSGMKMSGGPKQFGIDAEQVPELLERMRNMPVRFLGFHIFSGSQNLRVEAIAEAQAKTFELAYRLAEKAPSPVQTLNIGGGLGIPYFPGDQALDLATVGAKLEALMVNARERLPGTEVVMELGRFLVGEAGIFVCRVIDRKISRGQTFLIVDGGLHHHLAASGNFGQVIRKNYPVLVGNKVGSQSTEKATVVGPLCTPLDLLADRMELPCAELGDLIVILQSGAYGPTASPARFLSHPGAQEVLV